MPKRSTDREIVRWLGLALVLVLVGGVSLRMFHPDADSGSGEALTLAALIVAALASKRLQP